MSVASTDYSTYNETIYTNSCTEISKSQPTEEELWLNPKNIAELLRTSQYAELASRAMRDSKGSWKCRNTTILAEALPFLYAIEKQLKKKMDNQSIQTHNNSNPEDLPSKKFYSKADAVVIEFFQRNNDSYITHDFFYGIHNARTVDLEKTVDHIYHTVPKDSTCMAVIGEKKQMQNRLAYLTLWKMPLQKLYLAKTDCGNEELQSLIPQFKQLSHLSLYGCKEVGDEGLEGLVNLPLQSLDVSKSKISHIGIKAISSIKTIVELDLNFCDITDDDLEVVGKGLDNLQALGIVGCQKITGVSFFAFPKLKSINITCCNVTNAARELLPKDISVTNRMPGLGV
jgi:hypothetical protein